MEMNVATDKMILDSNRFVMLDLVNTISENETTKGYPIVQIVDPSNKNSFQNFEDIKSRIESLIKIVEKRNNLFTITLNVGVGHKTQLFR